MEIKRIEEGESGREKEEYRKRKNGEKPKKEKTPKKFKICPFLYQRPKLLSNVKTLRDLLESHS